MNGNDSGWGPPPGSGYGAPPQSGYGAPPQNGYGQAPYGSAPYGAPPMGPAPYGAPGYGNAPYGPGPYPPGPAQAAQLPTAYKNAGMLMLISGVKGALISFTLIISLIWVCVGAFWVITLAGAIAEIVMGALILSGKVSRNAKVVSILGLISGVFCLNVVGIVLEVIALTQLGKPEVEHFLAHHRG